MTLYTYDEIKAMSKERIKTELANSVYESAYILEALENIGKVRGNGHHMRQQLTELAEKLLNERWIDKDQDAVD